MGTWYPKDMTDTMNTTTEVTENQNIMVGFPSKKRGRPKLNVSWPNSEFTFSNLTNVNDSLSSSSLRKKMRAELVKGGLIKTGTLKTAFGRPQNVYKRSD